MTANTPEALAERCLELERLLREKDDELSAVRKALRYGADGSLWPPGQSMGDVVAGLVERMSYLYWTRRRGNSYWLYHVTPDGTTCLTMIAPTRDGKFILGFSGNTSSRYDTLDAARDAFIARFAQTSPATAKIIPPLP